MTEHTTQQYMQQIIFSFVALNYLVTQQMRSDARDCQIMYSTMHNRVLYLHKSQH